METFSRDLIGGKEIEKTVLNIVKKTYPDAHTVDGYCKDWDIYIPSLKKGIEVKSDQYSQKSGNIVVEESFNGKPSALSTTKASLWVFHTGNKIIQITPDLLRIIIAENNLKTVQFIAKGDTQPKKAYFVKQYLIEPRALAVNDVNDHDITIRMV